MRVVVVALARACGGEVLNQAAHRSVWSAPVRFVECDQQGIVFNAHYLVWADESVVPTLAAYGTPYATLEQHGLRQVVVGTELAWKSSARWGDVVQVDGGVGAVGRSSLVLIFAIRVGDRLCCTVRTTYVHLGADDRPVEIPADLRAAWTR